MSEAVVGRHPGILLAGARARTGLVLFIALAQILSVSLCERSPWPFLLFTALILAGPALAYHLLRTTTRWQGRFIASAYILTALACDLGLYYRVGLDSLSWNLLKGEMKADVSFSPPAPVVTREVQPLYPITDYTYEPIRDLPTILQKSYVFSPDYPIDDRFLEKTPPPHRTEPASFAEALDNPRWNSLLFPRKYFTLIHSGLPVPVLETLFAVHRPVFRLKHAGILLPEASFVPALRSLPPEQAALVVRDYAILQAEEATAGARLLSLDEASAVAAPPAAGSVHLDSFELNRVRVTAASRSGAFLDWADGYSASWRAFLDGKPTPVLRSGLAFKAVWVPEGVHQVVFEYRPGLFLASVAIFLATFFFAGTIGLGLMAKSRSEKSFRKRGRAEMDRTEDAQAKKTQASPLRAVGAFFARRTKGLAIYADRVRRTFRTGSRGGKWKSPSSH